MKVSIVKCDKCGAESFSVENLDNLFRFKCEKCGNYFFLTQRKQRKQPRYGLIYAKYVIWGSAKPSKKWSIKDNRLVSETGEQIYFTQEV
ncbi:unnamed protein product [marine sediment metagenome]|uniref:Uncharacterized protein n=1 Tax=marine sediment metagenome TaxID=412755 RepID=X1U0Q8_9ZZZZ